MSLFFKLLYCFFVTLSFGEEHSMNGSVYYNESSQEYSIITGIIDCVKGVACGYFNDSMNETGWGVLEIQVSASKGPRNIDDNIRMYAAGMLEGYLTSYQIYYGYYASWNGDGKETFSNYLPQLKNWTSIQREWINDEISSNPNSQYYKYLDGLMNQYDGQKYGYSIASAKFGLGGITDDFSWQFMSGNVDMEDWILAIDSNSRMNFNKMSDFELWEYKMKHTHCSGIVKVTPELDDIFFSHSTWCSYFWMNRIMKTYNFDLDLSPAAIKMQMPSYPGCLSSVDDFYLMDSGLVVMETTNGQFNNSLWDYLSPKTLFVWQRARIANALTNTGPEWVEMFAKHNSGTYNNQWIVLNSNLFVKNEPLNDDLLWILEQLPGSCHTEQVTSILERGYWASYNVPAISDVYKLSGNAAIAANNNEFSYDLAPRARIFRRDANKANNLTSVQKLMRYNNYLKDSIEEGRPGWAIMSRLDLNSSNPRADGGVDTKLVSLEMIQNFEITAQSGPTHDDLAPFTWSTDTFSQTPHMGMPVTYDFDWVTIKPQL